MPIKCPGLDCTLFQLLNPVKAQWPATHLVFVALVHTQGLGAEAVPHAEVAHQVGQVDGPDAPGQPQLLQGAFKLPVVQLAQVPGGGQATEGCSPSKGSWFGSRSTCGPMSHWQSPHSTEGSVLCHETLHPDHTLPRHNLKLPVCCAVVPGVEGPDSTSHISRGLCDFGQVTTLSGLNSFISKMRCLYHISGFLSFR